MEKNIFYRGAASRPKLWGYGEIDTKDVGKVREGGTFGERNDRWEMGYVFSNLHTVSYCELYKRHIDSQGTSSGFMFQCQLIVLNISLQLFFKCKVTSICLSLEGLLSYCRKFDKIGTPNFAFVSAFVRTVFEKRLEITDILVETTFVIQKNADSTRSSLFSLRLLQAYKINRGH